MMNGDGVRLCWDLCATGCEVDATLLEMSISGVRLCFTPSLTLLGAGVGNIRLERC